MASSTAGDFDDRHLNSGSEVQHVKNIKVYTRKVRKKPEKRSDNNGSAACTTVISTASGNTLAIHPPAIDGSPAAKKHLGNNIMRECEELVTEAVDSSQQLLQVQSPNRENFQLQTSRDEANDSARLKQSYQLAGQKQCQEQAEDNISSHGTRKGHACQNLEPKHLERLSPLPDNDEACNPKETRSHHTDDDKLLTTGIGPPNLGEVQSPLSSVNNLPNRQEYTTAQLQGGSDPKNDDISMTVIPPAPSGIGAADLNGVVEPLTITRVNDKIIFSLSKAAQKGDIKELRCKLEYELDQVRRLVNQLEGKELQLASSNTKVGISNLSNIHSGMAGCDIVGHIPPQRLDVPSNVLERNELVRITSDVSMMGPREMPVRFSRVNSDVGTIRASEPRPYNRQLSVAVMEKSHDTGEIVDKEKRTPKANQYYRNSEFLLGKDRLPSESNKKLKKMNGRKHIDQTEQVHGFDFGTDKNKNQVFKSCSILLQRLMKHKHGWVFNDSVDAKALGLHDYHVIIKHPMDLGTIKARLSQNWYKSPRDFVADVRLVFYNAMTYNPKGQDVHIMAEELSGIFEEKWAVIETKYNPYLKYHVYHDAGLPTPTSRRLYPQPHVAPTSGTLSTPVSIHAFAPAAAPPSHILAPSTPTMLNVDRAQTTVTKAVDFETQRSHVGRTPVPKKPKAKDPNKRDMTYDEKQKLSKNLQILASEKLEAIIQIIKKNDTALSQNDDEIEVDIDSVDPETLWELDRFVTNYKKSLSKKKRKAEIALQARTVSNQSVSLMNAAPAVLEVQSKSGTDVIDKGSSPPGVEVEKHDNNVNGITSSSSSSSDSGSSSSDSESDNSAAD